MRVCFFLEGYRSDLGRFHVVRLHPTKYSTPSLKHRLSFTDSECYPVQSCALAHGSIRVGLITLTTWQVLFMKTLVDLSTNEIFVFVLGGWS